MEDFDDFVDFDDFTEEKTENNLHDDELYFKICKLEFDETTTNYYKSMRERKLNIFTQEDDIDPNTCFQYPYIWDALTGEIIAKDPYGPLWFHPCELVYYFSEKCLIDLWHDEVDETGGVYEGYYGDLLGSGNNMFIKGRGYYTELYLFRIPIVDCYMPKGCNLSLITMGGKLELEDLQQIDNLMNKYHSKTYLTKYKKKPPSLVKMKEYYDIALSSEPCLMSIGYSKDDEKNMSNEELKNNRFRVNAEAVKNLQKIVGKYKNSF